MIWYRNLFPQADLWRWENRSHISGICHCGHFYAKTEFFKFIFWVALSKHWLLPLCEVISVTVPVNIGLLIPTFIVRFCMTSLVDTVKLYVTLLVIVSGCVLDCLYITVFLYVDTHHNIITDRVTISDCWCFWNRHLCHFALPEPRRYSSHGRVCLFLYCIAVYRPSFRDPPVQRADYSTK